MALIHIINIASLILAIICLVYLIYKLVIYLQTKMHKNLEDKINTLRKQKNSDLFIRESLKNEGCHEEQIAEAFRKLRWRKK